MGADNKKFGLTKGDAFTYQMTITPVAEAQSCECEGVFKVAAKGHTNQVRGVAGWDAAKKGVHWLDFWGGGLVEELFLTHCEGGKLYGAFVVKRSNGKTERSGVVLDYSKPGTMEAKFVSGARKGEVLSRWKRR